jgi:hypothetical protein
MLDPFKCRALWVMAVLMVMQISSTQAQPGEKTDVLHSCCQSKEGVEYVYSHGTNLSNLFFHCSFG